MFYTITYCICFHPRENPSSCSPLDRRAIALDRSDSGYRVYKLFIRTATTNECTSSSPQVGNSLNLFASSLIIICERHVNCHASGMCRPWAALLNYSKCTDRSLFKVFLVDTPLLRETIVYEGTARVPVFLWTSDKVCWIWSVFGVWRENGENLTISYWIAVFNVYSITLVAKI